VTRNAGDLADMFAFWPSNDNPTHLIFCIEGARQDLGTFLSGGLVKKFNPSVQRIKLSDGSADTALRGMSRCDGIRRTPWNTILAIEETNDGGAYEIINPLSVTNYTVTDRALGTIIDENGAPSTSSILKRTALPTMAWEGLAVLPSGVVIAGDELRPGTGAQDTDGGAIFKFVPAVPHTSQSPIASLTESPLAAGNVYALRLSCITGVQYGQGCEIGSGAWIAVGAPTARADADKGGATGYYRPEDLEWDEEYKGEGVRFCWTNTGESDIANYGEVLCGVDRAPLVADLSQQTVMANRFVEGDADFNQPDNFEFQPRTGNHYVIEDNANGDIFACLPDGADRDIKTDGCVKILSVKDSSAEPTGFKFTADGRTAYLSIQHSNDTSMPKFDDYGTDDIIKITGFKVPNGSRGNRRE
jgi:secreted PhoX family phosphatase